MSSETTHNNSHTYKHVFSQPIGMSTLIQFKDVRTCTPECTNASKLVIEKRGQREYIFTREHELTSVMHEHLMQCGVVNVCIKSAAVYMHMYMCSPVRNISKQN